MAALNSRGQTEDDELMELIDQAILDMGQREYLPLKEKIRLRTSLFDSFRRLDILQELVDNREITEIMVNGKDHIFVESHGQIRPWENHFESLEQLEDMIQQIVSRVNRIVNVSSPIVDARLEDGSRVHVVPPPVALDGPTLTIRKFPEPITMEKLMAFGAISSEAAEFLKRLVAARYNIFISGGTNSGKSTFFKRAVGLYPLGREACYDRGFGGASDPPRSQSGPFGDQERQRRGGGADHHGRPDQGIPEDEPQPDRGRRGPGEGGAGHAERHEYGP